MKYLYIILLGFLVVAGCSGKKENQANQNSSLVTKEVNYSTDGTPLKGFIAYDSSFSGKRPGIIVVHEWRSEERRVGKECRSRWSPYH